VKGSGSCPVCQYPTTDIRERDYGERLNVDCPRCGPFQITGTAAAMAEKREQSPLLSAWIREKSESRQRPPTISSDNIDSVAASFPEYSVADKLLLLLAALGRRSKYPGCPVPILPDRDYSICWARNESELIFYITTLEERGLVTDIDGHERPLDQHDLNLVVTSAGWHEIDALSRTSAHSNQAFVAMSFSSELQGPYDSAIAPAIREAGYRAYRVDAEPHLDRIDVKIMAEIRLSRFLVADVTEQKKGVYFEAGYALGLGLPVIWSVRKDDLANVHFDTRQYNHIVWETSEELRDRLRDFVIALIGARGN
jgi:nucleoside 2-deoxyribosyltransferase